MKQQIRSLDQSLYQVKVPLPFPLRWVNSYVVRGRSGYTILDPGLHTEEAERLWEQAMEEIGFRESDVERIVLTHYHPDHYGMAGWFQERSGRGVPVLLSREGHQLAEALWGADPSLNDMIYADFLAHGMDKEKADAMIPHLEGFIPLVSPKPAVTYMNDSYDIPIGDRIYRAIHTPGHATGHLCFWDEERAWLFCGDHVLPQITPNVSYLPGGDPDPLSSFLDSLAEVAELPAAMALPGHRDPFVGFSDRAREIMRHHGERLTQILAGLSEPSTAYEVCLRLFGQRLTIHQLRFAMGETLAHLIYLEKRQKVRTIVDDHGTIRYCSVNTI